MKRSPSVALLLAGCALLVALMGCATGSRTSSRAGLGPPRAFNFETDTLAYANQLVWEYEFDPVSGRTLHRRSAGRDLYTHRCFVVARTARQFFHHARFDPALPMATPEEYERAVRQVLARPSRERSLPERAVIIPGYRDLRTFSAAHEPLLKTLSSGPWRSYLQRGHWRILLPFTRKQQTRVAASFAERIEQGEILIAHIVRFPALTINHAVLLFSAGSANGEVQFRGYDPNEPDWPITLTFDRGREAFFFPRTRYFAGGEVDVYEVYHGWAY